MEGALAWGKLHNYFVTSMLGFQRDSKTAIAASDPEPMVV